MGSGCLGEEGRSLEVSSSGVLSGGEVRVYRRWLFRVDVFAGGIWPVLILLLLLLLLSFCTFMFLSLCCVDRDQKIVVLLHGDKVIHRML